MRHRLAVLAAALLFSTGGAVIKVTALPSWHVAGLRSLIAAAFLLLALPAARAWPRPGQWPAAAASAVTVVLFVLANKLTTSASAIFLQATAPAWLILLSPRLLGEPSRARDLLAAAGMAAGMTLLFLAPGAPTTLAPVPWLGDLLAATTGLSWALVVVALRRAERESAGDSLPVLVTGHLLAFAVCLPMIAAAGPVPIAAADVGALLFLGVVQVGTASLLLARAIRHVPAVETSLLVLLEPATNPLWAWLVAGERPGWPALAGGAVILATALAHVLASTRRPPTDPATRVTGPVD